MIFSILISSLLISLIKSDNCLKTEIWKKFQNEYNVTYDNAGITLKA
jgi:hypothetical protein